MKPNDLPQDNKGVPGCVSEPHPGEENAPIPGTNSAAKKTEQKKIGDVVSDPNCYGH